MDSPTEQEVEDLSEELWKACGEWGEPDSYGEVAAYLLREYDLIPKAK